MSLTGWTPQTDCLGFGIHRTPASINGTFSVDLQNHVSFSKGLMGLFTPFKQVLVWQLNSITQEHLDCFSKQRLPSAPCAPQWEPHVLRVRKESPLRSVQNLVYGLYCCWDYLRQCVTPFLQGSHVTLLLGHLCGWLAVIAAEACVHTLPGCFLTSEKSRSDLLGHHSYPERLLARNHHSLLKVIQLASMGFCNCQVRGRSDSSSVLKVV